MAPKAEKKPAKKVAKKVAGGKGKKGKSKVESFKIYIYKVLKQVSNAAAATGSYASRFQMPFTRCSMSLTDSMLASLHCCGTSAC